MGGRCAGCGYSAASVLKVRTHTLTCPSFIYLFKNAPERALSPEAEAERWNTYRRSDEAANEKFEKKEVLREGYREINRVKVEAQEARWSSKQFKGLHLSPLAAVPTPIPVNGRIDELAGDASDPARRVGVSAVDILASEG